MKRTLQWTASAALCGLLLTALVAGRAAQGDTIAIDHAATPFPPVNVGIHELFPRGR